MSPKKTKAWQEMTAKDGAVKAHWSYLHDAWNSMGTVELQARQSELNALLRENGVSYNIYSETHEKDWPLDILPVVIPSAEWALLERGMIQRAELQSLIFKDLHGQRKLFTEGIIPPEFLYAHPDWYPVTCPPELAGNAHVPLVGFDLTRGVDGEWRVLADRVQNPSGAGYALQNRIMMSKVFPSLYREAGVHRLVHWFRALRNELKAAAPLGVENPHVVLLSPGPGHETWFEHSYLATYLGLTLVRGQDLELRGDHIWVKAVGGDKQVDVILRRVNDAWCDPLYLKSDSLLGVPGLVRAVQAGTVAVVNPLGSGVLHNPGLLPFLPKICNQLLGENLILPSLPTWWCGESASLSYVLANLNKMVIKSVYPSPDQQSVFADQLDSTSLQELKTRLQAQPRLWIAQEQCIHSTTPAFQGGAIVDRHMVLRTFACGNPQSGYRIMPGGLTRFGASEGELVVSNQHGGISKDTWILSSEPEREALNREALLSVGGAEVNAPLPAAAAESLFWMGRYLERSLVLIRRLRDVLEYEPGELISYELSLAIESITGGLWMVPFDDLNQQMQKTIFDSQLPGSLAFDVYWLTWNARSLRGIIGAESLGIVQRLGETSTAAKSLELGLKLGQHLDTLSMQLRALSSTFMDWSQDDPRRIFSQLGQKYEWLHISLNILRTVRNLSPTASLRKILEVDKGAPPSLVQMGDDVINQALADALRPRSLTSTVERVVTILARLPKQSKNSRGKSEALALKLLSGLVLDELDKLPDLLVELDKSLKENYFIVQSTQGWLKSE